MVETRVIVWTTWVTVAIIWAVQDATVSAGQVPTIPESEVNRVITDRNYVKKQIDCLLSRAKCDNTGNQLKFALPEVLARNCRSCSHQQMINARKIVDFVKISYPSEWTQIQAKYGGNRG